MSWFVKNTAPSELFLPLKSHCEGTTHSMFSVIYYFSIEIYARQSCRVLHSTRCLSRTPIE